MFSFAYRYRAAALPVRKEFCFQLYSDACLRVVYPIQKQIHHYVRVRRGVDFARIDFTRFVLATAPQLTRRSSRTSRPSARRQRRQGRVRLRHPPRARCPETSFRPRGMSPPGCAGYSAPSCERSRSFGHGVISPGARHKPDFDGVRVTGFPAGPWSGRGIGVRWS